MKGDFYNSSTHGRIRLSVRGRQLLAAERDAAQGAIYAGDFRDNDAALSKARGDLAYYMGELEQRNAEQRETIQKLTRPKTATEMLAEGYGMGPTRMQALQDDLNRTTYKRLAELQASLYENFLKGPPPVYLDLETHSFQSLDRYRKETPVTDQKNAEQAKPAPKTRSQLLTDATCELCAAQRNLEALQATPSGIPEGIVTYAPSGSAMVSSVIELVKEQWPALEKKAVARAKARVAKAEKAVTALLA